MSKASQVPPVSTAAAADPLVVSESLVIRQVQMGDRSVTYGFALDYDITVAEIAGVIASSLLTPRDFTPGMLEDTPRCELLAKGFVNLARAIVAETKRTEPAKDAR